MRFLLVLVIFVAAITCPVMAQPADSNAAQAQPARPTFDLSQLPKHWQWERATEPHWQSDVFVLQAGQEHQQSVLLVHGLNQAGFTDWLNVIPELEKRYHVIVIDLPGFGRSSNPSIRYSPDNYAKILSWVATTYAHSPVMIVGHSMGGAISLQYTADYPNQVKRLVLVDAAGILERTALLKSNSELALNLDSLPKPLSDVGNAVLGVGQAALEWVGGVGAPTTVLKQSDAAWNTVFKDRPNANAAMGLVMHNFSDAIETVETGTFIIWGENDPIAPLRTGYLLAGQMQNAQLSIIEGAEHMPMNSHTPVFNQYLLQALTQEEPRQRQARFSTPLSGELRCKNKSDMSYSGNFNRVIIDGCKYVTLRHVTTRELRVNNSTVDLYNVRVVNNDKAAVTAEESVIVATNSRFEGVPAILSNGSRWDLAGVKVVSPEDEAIRITTRSRFVFSVSHIHTPSLQRDLHMNLNGEQVVLDRLLQY